MTRWMLLLTLACAVFAVKAEEKSAQPPGIDVELRLGIPMRDGVRLNADLYRPHAQSGPLPVLFCINPYTADITHAIGSYFAEHGYVFVAIDSRGRNGSQGEFQSWTGEGRDGYDAVEWLARQPWSNGRVGAWGGSYLGFTQWSTLKERPPHLRTIVPTASVRPGLDFPLSGGIFYSYDVQWLAFVSGVAGHANLFGDSAYWRGKFARRYFDNAAFRTLDRIAGNSSRIFQDYLKHPSFDAYWQSLAPNAQQYASIDVPILTITGHWDDDQIGAMSYYNEHMRYGSDAARARHYLVIGPWDHSGTRRPQKETGGLKLGDASLVDIRQLHLQWYDWTLKDGKKPDFLKQRVAYYVTGEEAWKYADRLEDIATPRTYYLSSTGSANDVVHSGALTLAPPRPDEPADTYVDDPLDVRPGRAELDRGDTSGNEVVDQTTAFDLHGAGVVYHSDILAAPIELSGTPRGAFWLSIDVPDADFVARLQEVRADGSAVNLSTMMVRARYRESVTRAKPVVPGEALRYDFDRFNFISRRIEKGSRLRLTLGAVNSIQFQKNYHGGGDVSDETAADARTAHVRVLHDAAHPSAVALPIAAAAAGS